MVTIILTRLVPRGIFFFRRGNVFRQEQGTQYGTTSKLKGKKMRSENHGVGLKRLRFKGRPSAVVNVVFPHLLAAIATSIKSRIVRKPFFFLS